MFFKYFLRFVCFYFLFQLLRCIMVGWVSYVLNGDVILAVITGKDSREFANSKAFARYSRRRVIVR